MFENRPNNPTPSSEPVESIVQRRPTAEEIKAKIYAAEDDQDFFENTPGLYEVAPRDDEIMVAAEKYAEEYSNNPNPIGCAVVRETLQEDGSLAREVLFLGANFSEYHAEHDNPITHGCERYDKETGKSLYPSGQGYDICPGCDYHNHAEARTVRQALEAGVDLSGTKMWMKGHYWGCKPCWEAVDSAGMIGMVVSEGAREEYAERKKAREERVKAQSDTKT